MMNERPGSAASGSPNHMLSLFDWSPASLAALVAEAGAMKASPGAYQTALGSASAVLLFEKPSLRTRVSFEVGMARLGGHALYLDHNSAKLDVRESVEDYAANLCQWCDAIVARVDRHSTLERMAAVSTVPVINALSDVEHPCQALADMLTLREVLGDLAGARLAYIGDGNNVCHALMAAGAKLGVSVTVITPQGHEPDAGYLSAAQAEGARTGATIRVVADPAAVAGHDAVYTDKWVSMGPGGDADCGAVAAEFEAYRVTARLMDAAGDHAVFMHCLPAKRGAEVDAEVIDGPRSVVLQQARNRMWAQNALLVELLGAAAARPAGRTMLARDSFPRVTASVA